MEGLMVTCPLTPYTSHLLSSSCSSPRSFGLSFLQTPPRDDALALLLTFGSANTWYRDSHPTRLVPCPAHTIEIAAVEQSSSGPLGSRPTQAHWCPVVGLRRVIEPCHRRRSLLRKWL